MLLQQSVNKMLITSFAGVCITDLIFVRVILDTWLPMASN